MKRRIEDDLKDRGHRLREVAPVAVSLAGRLARHPTLLPEAGRKVLSRFVDRRHRSRAVPSAEPGMRVEPVVATLLGVDPRTVGAAIEAETFRGLMKELESYRVPGSNTDVGGAAFLELCYSILRLIKPEVVVETGVAHGYSTAAILQALEDNGRGKLFSIDLPAFRPGVTRLTAGAVPSRLRSSTRWELALGPERKILPGLLRRIGPLDLFLHDSDKSYRGMLRCSRLVWPHLRPGGVLMVDDIQSNDAFLDFVEERDLTPQFIRKPIRHGVYRWDASFWVGLLRKPVMDGRFES